MKIKRVLLMIFSALTLISVVFAIINASMTGDLGKVALAEFFAIIFLLLGLITTLIDTKKLFPKKEHSHEEPKMAEEYDFSEFLKDNVGKEVSNEFDDFIKERDNFHDTDIKKDYIDNLNLDLYDRDQNQLRKDIQDALSGHKQEVQKKTKKEVFKKTEKKESIPKIIKKNEIIDIKPKKQNYKITQEEPEDDFGEPQDIGTFRTKRPSIIIGDSGKNIFHKDSCADIRDIAEEDYMRFGSISEAILKNYNYCKKCIK